jgi:hypothetical protein
MQLTFRKPVAGKDVEVRLYVGPECAESVFRPGAPQAQEATLQLGPDHGGHLQIILAPGYPQTLTFLHKLVEDAEAAIAWAQDMLCDHCEEDVREPGSRYCRECLAGAHDEHRLADDLERLRDFRAEEAADRVARGAA